MCVLGLGYVGLPTAAVLATVGRRVAGVDLRRDVLDTINAGKIHIVEPELDAVTDRVERGEPGVGVEDAARLGVMVDRCSHATIIPQGDGAPTRRRTPARSPRG